MPSNGIFCVTNLSVNLEAMGCVTLIRAAVPPIRHSLADCLTRKGFAKFPPRSLARVCNRRSPLIANLMHLVLVGRKFEVLLLRQPGLRGLIPRPLLRDDRVLRVDPVVEVRPERVSANRPPNGGR